MASEGPNSPTVATDEGDWVNPTNVYSSNDQRANDPGSNNHILRAYTFGFSIPAGSTIDGFYVEVEGYGVEDNDLRRRIDVALSKSGYTLEGDWEVSNLLPKGVGLEAHIGMGGPTNKWGGTWNASDVNNSDFGIIIRQDYDGNYGLIYIDHIRVTVYYSGGGAGKSWATVVY